MFAVFLPNSIQRFIQRYIYFSLFSTTS